MSATASTLAASVPPAPVWVRAGQLLFWVGVCLTLYIPMIASLGEQDVKWSQLDWHNKAVPYSSIALGGLVLLVGWLRHPCDDTELRWNGIKLRPDGTLLGPVLKELVGLCLLAFGLCLLFVLYSQFTTFMREGSLHFLLAYQVLCMSGFSLYEMFWFAPARHRATTSYLNTLTGPTAHYLICVAWPLLIVRNLMLRPLPTPLPDSEAITN